MRERLVAATRRLSATGLNPGRSGEVAFAGGTLLANHGVVALGATVEEAAELAEKVEALARLYCLALQAGEPALLDEVEMSRVVAKLRTYGK